MSIHWFLLIIFFIGLALYLFPSIDPLIKKILYVVAVVALLIWLLGVFGIMNIRWN